MKIVGILFLFFALMLGAWRQFNSMIAFKIGDTSASRAWASSIVQVFSWVAVVAAAVTGAVLVIYPAESGFQQFMFGVILAARLFASMLLAGYWMRRHYPEQFE